MVKERQTIVMDLYLDFLSPGITTLGPGLRIGLWVQGCSFRCDGCISPDLWQREEQQRVEVLQVFQQILSYAPENTGLTVSGGEPFEQAEALGAIFLLIRQYTALDILVYSGYTLDEILSGSKAKKEMLRLTDVLIDGRYHKDLPTNKLWRGSDNQQMHLLSERAQKYSSFIEEEYSLSRLFQIEITTENNFRIIGIPGKGDMERFKKGLFKRGLILNRITEREKEF